MDVGHLLQNIPRKHKYQNIRPGDTVRVHYRVVEGERVRTQQLQGVVMWMTRGGPNANMTIRRVIQGIGVERTFLLNSPRLEQIEVVRQGKVRRARLYYQRGRTGRKARITEGTRPRKVEAVEEIVPQDAAPPAEEPLEEPTTAEETRDQEVDAVVEAEETRAQDGDVDEDSEEHSDSN